MLAPPISGHVADTRSRRASSSPAIGFFARVMISCAVSPELTSHGPFIHSPSMPILVRIVLFFALLLPVTAAPKPLEKFENCTFIPADWADGDSFRIRTAAGKEHTIRLYGVDCLETNVNSETDERRLRQQRQYFGITNSSGGGRQSIKLAQDFGRKATQKTAGLLRQPFTVHTRFQDAWGDPRFKRVYGIVTCADGTDLASELVKAGLARAYGFDSDTPDGKTLKQAKETLKCLELQAAKRGVGIWAMTDWNSLPAERQQLHEQSALPKTVDKAPRLPVGFKLNLNTAERLEIVKLPGIKAATADLIIKHRPYSKPDDLLKVPGITDAKIQKMKPYLIFSRQ